MIGLTCFTQPTIEPVALSEAMLHLRIYDESPSSNTEASLIQSMITSARRWCEKFQNRAFITQTWDLYLDNFPTESYIRIPLPPLQSVTYLKYKDAAGSLQTMDTDNYIVDIKQEPGRVALIYGQSWPSTYGEAQAVQIRFVAGYGDDAEDVPENVRSAIKIYVADLYETRQSQEPASGVGEGAYGHAVKMLLWPERVVPV